MAAFEGSVDVLLDRLPCPILLVNDDGSVRHFNSALLLFVERPAHWLSERGVGDWLEAGEEVLPPAARRSRTVTAHLRDIQGQRRSLRLAMNPLPETGWVFVLSTGPFGTRDGTPSLEDLAGRFAQRLDNIVATLLGSVSAALMEEPDEPIAEGLREALAAAQDLAGLQAELRNIGRQTVVQMATVSLSSLVTDALPMMRAALGAGVELAFKPSEHADFIDADADLLHTALVRIAGFLSRNLSLGCRCSVEVHVVPNTAAPIRLLVADDGPGIPLDERSAAAGAGGQDPRDEFGLAVVHGIVGQHRGRLLIDSQLGAGTRVHIEFQPSRLGERFDLPGALLPRGHETILVVDDDDSLRSILKQILSHQGFRVVEAGNGVEASVVLRRRVQELDLLLIDAVLPGRSGLEIIAEVRTLRPDLPVLLITGYSREALGARIRDSVPVLAKPFGPATVVRRIRRLLDERR